MNGLRTSRGPDPLPRLSWALFSGVSGLALGACVFAAVATGSRSNVGLTLLGGLIVVGIAAALMDAIVSPFPDHDGRQAPFGSVDVGAAAGTAVASGVVTAAVAEGSCT